MDRFINRHKGLDFLANFELKGEHVQFFSSSLENNAYEKELSNILVPRLSKSVLKFDRFGLNRNVKRDRDDRFISDTPERILDAPFMINDFYLNLMDWSDSGLVIALGHTVYLYQYSDCSVHRIISLKDWEYVSSICWMKNGQYIAVGTSTSFIHIIDTCTRVLIYSTNAHDDRVSCLSSNCFIISSGSKDHTIRHRDIRNTQNSLRVCCHSSEVCGLKWSGLDHIIASGGNDKRLNIWDLRYTNGTSRLLHSIHSHRAAVKAIAWCPWKKSLLASGGGEDFTIRFWDARSGIIQNEIKTESQICGLQWFNKEIVAVHGYSKNNITIWKYPKLSKVKELNGHTACILHSAKSPDGKKLVTFSADETVRFWNILSEDTNKKPNYHVWGPNSTIR